MKITFWGVRGSVPSPILGWQIEDKIVAGITEAMAAGLPKNASADAVRAWLRTQPFSKRSTHGGNTTCVELRTSNSPTPIILDMGTGLRELGTKQMKELFTTKELSGYIFQSHVHWDHIQGVPFWKPLYAPRRMFPHCRFTFFGGKEWELDLQAALHQQMQGQVFPVQFEEIRRVGMTMHFETVHDMWSTNLQNGVMVSARKLNHPQETFGYRVKDHDGKVVAFTTDHEPYAEGIPRGLLELVKDADVWITDCQYTLHEYMGQASGVQKFGWGHSYPEYIARVAKEAQPKMVITTHHDPEASDEAIEAIASTVGNLSGISTLPAYEGLSFNI